MSSVNKVILVGNLGADPELRTVGDTQVCSLSVATTEVWTKDGQKQEKTEWHKVNVWGPQAGSCAKFLTKGRQVYVEGRIETRTYEKDGQTKYSTEIKAHDVKFLGQNTGGQGAEPSKPQKTKKTGNTIKPSQRGMQDEVGDGDDLPF